MARHRPTTALVALVTAVAASGSPAALGAQVQRTITRPADARGMMCPAFRSPAGDKKLGVQAADAVRSRLSQDIAYKQLWQIPKQDIVATLEASGFPPDEPVAPNDAKELAKILRADEILEASVTRDGGKFRIVPRLRLARDVALVQPLPVQEGGRLDIVATQVSRDVQAMRKQLPFETQCVRHYRDQKYAEAAEAARQGIAAYPQATLARTCLLNAYSAMKKPGDSLMALAQEILAIDPHSRTSLAVVGQAYKDKGDIQRALENWTRLLAEDPTNTRLAESIVNEIASSGPGMAVHAIPIIDTAVIANPGEPKLQDLRFRIYLAAQKWKEAPVIGEELVKLDTTYLDSLWFTRMAAAFASDSQPQKAAEITARATAKYPQNVSMWLLYAQMLEQAGQTQQAMVATRRALDLDPKQTNAWLRLISAYATMNQPDSVLVAARTASSRVDSAGKALVSQFVLSQGNRLFQEAQKTKVRADYEKALPYLYLADTLSGGGQPRWQARLLVGASSLIMGQTLIQEAAKEKDKAAGCQMAQQAQADLLNAQVMLPDGGKFNPQLAGQLLQSHMQVADYADKVNKAFCPKPK